MSLPSYFTVPLTSNTAYILQHYCLLHTGVYIVSLVTGTVCIIVHHRLIECISSFDHDERFTVHWLFCRDVKRVLFIPYALHDRDGYAKTARDKFKSLGMSSTTVYSHSLTGLLTCVCRGWCSVHSSECCLLSGYEVDSIHEASDPVEAVRKAQGIFIGKEYQQM